MRWADADPSCRARRRLRRSALVRPGWAAISTELHGGPVPYRLRRSGRLRAGDPALAVLRGAIRRLAAADDAAVRGLLVHVDAGRTVLGSAQRSGRAAAGADG